MDSDPRYSPGHIIKGDKKDIANYRPNSLLNLDHKIYTANSKELNAKNISYYNR